MEIFSKFRKLLFITFVIIFIVTFFIRDNYRNITEIEPQVLNQPNQVEAANKNVINFEKDGYSYEITPLYDYEISALVVHRLIYDVWYSLRETDSAFIDD